MVVSEEEMDNIANEALEAVLGCTWRRGNKGRKAFNNVKRTAQPVLGERISAERRAEAELEHQTCWREGARVAWLEESVKDDNESIKKIYISKYFMHSLFVMIKSERVLPLSNVLDISCSCNIAMRTSLQSLEDVIPDSYVPAPDNYLKLFLKLLFIDC